MRMGTFSGDASMKGRPACNDTPMTPCCCIINFVFNGYHKINMKMFNVQQWPKHWNKMILFSVSGHKTSNMVSSLAMLFGKCSDVFAAAAASILNPVLAHERH